MTCAMEFFSEKSQPGSRTGSRAGSRQQSRGTDGKPPSGPKRDPATVTHSEPKPQPEGPRLDYFVDLLEARPMHVRQIQNYKGTGLNLANWGNFVAVPPVAPNGGKIGLFPVGVLAKALCPPHLNPLLFNNMNLLRKRPTMSISFEPPFRY